MKFNNLTLFFLLVSLLCGEFQKALYVLIIVVFHELGHALITLILGYKIEKIEIYPFGGITKIDKKLNDHFLNDFLIAIFGVLFQGILLILIKDEYFTYLNKAILLFNLLPIIPLDGAKITFEVLCLFMPYKKALKVNNLISLIGINIYFILNYEYNLNNYLIITLFIYKTLEAIKDGRLIFYKFILERKLYNIKHRKVLNKNISISDYHKDIKYYYFDGKKVLDERAYLLNKDR